MDLKNLRIEKGYSLQQVAGSDDVPPGQISIFDEEENERPFAEPKAEYQEKKGIFD